MAVSKNKCLTKGGKKGAKKKLVDPFSKKDRYDVRAPAMFNIRNSGKTLVTRTQGTKITSNGLKGRVFEMSLADLQNDEVAFRKFKLITEDVQGKNCLTNFHGMDLLLLSHFSRVPLCVTPQTAAHQAPPSLNDEFEQTLGNTEGQGRLECCSPWGWKELDIT